MTVARVQGSEGAANPHHEDRRAGDILGCRISAISRRDVLERVRVWVAEGSSRYIVVCNVHSVMTAWRDPQFRAVINGADLATPDGMPLVWGLRLLGFRRQERVCGPDLMLDLCRLAAAEGYPVFLYGGTEETLEKLQARLEGMLPALSVAGRFAPPFRPLSRQEDEAVTAMIAASGARIVFVGIGCPKQEVWMAAHSGTIPAVMVGVGAAFDFHGGRLRRAPSWMQRSGLEWLFRLLAEPRRLWRRYLVNNPLFVALFLHQLLTRPERGASKGHTSI